MALNEISAAQGGDLEDHPAAADDGAKGTTVAAEVCSTIEISRRISDQTGHGRCPVRSAGETVQHGLLAGLIQLEHRSAATSAGTGTLKIRLTPPTLLERRFINS